MTVPEAFKLGDRIFGGLFAGDGLTFQRPAQQRDVREEVTNMRTPAVTVYYSTT